jgi:hypothetical protein
VNLEFLYAAFNISVIPAWALLLFAPGWSWTNRLVHRVWIPGLLCIGWVCIYALKPEAPPGGGIGSLKEFMVLITSPYSALLVWIQLITWDLFIGAWQVRDARRRGIHHGWVIPGLLCTFLFGPVGLLIYFVIRFAVKRVASLQEIGAQQS